MEVKKPSYSDLANENQKLREKLEQMENQHYLIHQIEEICHYLPAAVYKFKIDANGVFHIPYMSQSAETILERPVNKLKDSSLLLDTIHPADIDEFSRSIQISREKLIPWFCEFRLKFTNKTKWLRGNSTPHLQSDGSIVWDGLIQDITEIKVKEAELLQAKERAEESDRLKSAFLANMSHEIRTPLNGILGFSQLITADDSTTEKRNFYGEIIKNSCDQLLNVINDIIDISKIEANQIEMKLTPVNINYILEKIISIHFENITHRNLILHKNFALSDQECLFVCDETKLYQILNNLLSNAIKFTEQGSIDIGYMIKNPFIEFYVKDTGVGINKEDQQIIFERFRQVETTLSRRRGGSGLGLSISKAYVELIGGKIWLESDLDKGTTLFFTIPLLAHTTSITPSQSPPINSELMQNVTIMVAEDDAINALYMKELLSGMGASAIIARNGHEAVDLVKANKHINLILMDIQMPVMNGLEATQIIKSFTQIPIIAVTAFALSKDKEYYLQNGCDDYISKPIQKNVLITTIEKYL